MPTTLPKIKVKGTGRVYDPVPPKLTGQQLLIQYVRVGTVALWDKNPKLHDMGGLIESFKMHGFRDAPIYDANLNDGNGGIVAGNGRAIALMTMESDGEYDPPEGIAVDEDGNWYMPVQFGVNARDIAMAQAFGVDHNNLTMTGADFSLFDIAGLWDRSGLDELLQDIAKDGGLLASFDLNDIDSLLVPPPDFGNMDTNTKAPEVDEAYEGLKVTVLVNNPTAHIETIQAIRQLLDDNPDWDAKIA